MVVIQHYIYIKTFEKKMEGSHNKRILKAIDSNNTNFLPIQKIEKNIIFKNFGQKLF